MAGTSQLVQIEVGPPPRLPKPEWLRAKAPVGENFHNLKKLARGLGLHTVCESAQCPNIGECWNHRTATFMLLGDICTRRCGFCAVPKGRPEPIDWDEPRRVAEAVATLGLKHAVVTSVNRDDDNVGGAKVFAETIREIRELIPDCRIEVLIPDFQGLEEPLKIVLAAQPDVLNHISATAVFANQFCASCRLQGRSLNLIFQELNRAGRKGLVKFQISELKILYFYEHKGCSGNSVALVLSGERWDDRRPMPDDH